MDRLSIHGAVVMGFRVIQSLESSGSLRRTAQVVVHGNGSNEALMRSRLRTMGPILLAMKWDTI